MKKIYIILLALLSYGMGNAQGSDVVIMLDNSFTVDSTEYTQMIGSANSVIDQILGCNSNRVAVTHFSSQYVSGNNIPKIYIERDFSLTNGTIGNRPLQENVGYLHESLDILGDALDGNSNANILGVTSSLNRDYSNNLVILVFTNLRRPQGSGSFSAGTPLAGDAEFLVNPYSAEYNTAAAFNNYNTFKSSLLNGNNQETRLARFVVVHLLPGYSQGIDNEARKAAAQIASGGGNYPYNSNNIEEFPGDDNSDRYYFKIDGSNGFNLNPAQISSVSGSTCQISLSPTAIGINNTQNKNCPTFPINVTGTYSLATGDTLGGITLEIYNENDVKVNTLTLPSTTSSTFTFSNIIKSNFGTYPDNHEFYFKVNMIVTRGTSSVSLSILTSDKTNSISNDILLSCCDNCPTITTQVVSGATDNQQAPTCIIAKNIINNGAMASYHAPEILLQDDFLASTGSIARLYTDPCNSTPPFSFRKVRSKESTNKTLSNTPISLSIHPNPNNGLFTVSLGSESSGQISIMDMNGRTILTQSYNGSEINIDLIGQANGIYIIQIISGDNVVTKKLIKK